MDNLLCFDTFLTELKKEVLSFDVYVRYTVEVLIFLMKCFYFYFREPGGDIFSPVYTHDDSSLSTGFSGTTLFI